MLKQVPLTCSGHSRPVVYLSFSEFVNSTYYLISASKDGNPMLRDGATGDWIGTFQGHKGAVWSCALNSDATRAATGSADFSAKIWNAESGDELHTFPHDHIVRSVDLPRDSQQAQLLLTSSKNCLYLYDLEKNDEEPSKIVAHGVNIKQCSYVPEKGHLVLSSADDNVIKLWDLRTNGAIRQLALPAPFHSFEISRNGSILSVGCGRQAQFYDLMNLSLIKKLDFQCSVYSVSLKPDESTFVCGGEDFKIYCLNYDTCTEIDSYKGHFGPVHCIRFSPDGELYASGSEDGTIRLWQSNLGKNYGLWKVENNDDD